MEGNYKQESQIPTRPVPGQSDLCLLSGDVGCFLCSLHGSVHLLSDLTGPEWDQVLPFAAHQDVLFVLPFLFGAIGKRGATVAVALVAEPLPLVLEAVGASTDTESGPLVVLPLPTVGLSCCGVHVVVCDGQLCVCVSKTGKGKRLYGGFSVFFLFVQLIQKDK